MAARGTQLVLIITLTVFHEACSQQLIAVSTVPYSSMIVSQPENATNVPLYCEVFRVGIGQRSSEWSMRRPGDATDTDLRFSLVDSLVPRPSNGSSMAAQSEGVGRVWGRD